MSWNTQESEEASSDTLSARVALHHARRDVGRNAHAAASAPPSLAVALVLLALFAGLGFRV